jgi:uncharacterized membrane protein YczE
MGLFDLLIRIAFGIAGTALMLLAGGLIGFAGLQLFGLAGITDRSTGSALLEAVGYTVIAIAVFDVGKYIVEEEVIRAREMRQAGEARRSITKFLSTIVIAVFLEALVAVFEAGKTDIATMLYPTFLLIGGVALIVGLGLYQRLSVVAEKEVATTPELENDPKA